MIFEFYVFTSRAAIPTPSGGSIFRCTTKDRGERRAKGVATPFNPPEFMRDRKPDVLWFYLLAMVQLTRLSRRRRSAYSLASACCALTVVRQHRRKKYPWGAVPRKNERLTQPPDCRVCKTLVILRVPTISPHLVQYARVRRKQCLQPRSVLQRGSALFRRSYTKQQLPARHRTSLNRVKCTNANS